VEPGGAEVFSFHATQLSERILSLPTGTAIQTADIQKICSLIQFVIENATEIEERLSETIE